MHFNVGTLQKIGDLQDVFPDSLTLSAAQKEQERMLQHADVGFAKMRGGTWTSRCLHILQKHLDRYDYYDVRVNTYVHSLRKGWYPDLPIWHCRSVYQNQTNLVFHPDIDKDVRHFLLCSHTPTIQFLEDRDIALKFCQNWENVHNEIQSRQVTPFCIPPGRMVECNALELMRAVQGQESGWRYLFWATLFPQDDPRRGKCRNNVRWQTQIYLKR